MKEIFCLLFVCFASIVMCGVADAASKVAPPNPHKAEWITGEMAKTLDTIKRVDQKGIMYEMDYTSNYYDPAIIEMVKNAAASLTTGCSAFSTYNTQKEFLTCRNYDYRHKDSSGAFTGLNVVIRTAPKGKLKSINVCDAFWLNPSAYYAGVLDDGKTDTSLMLLAPYICVDGMNEAGLTASLLLTDLKDGEQHINQSSGKERIIPSMLLRYIIDNAHNIAEAVEIAKSYDVYTPGDTDLHIYLGDKNGDSAVFEWRKYGEDKGHKLYVTYTNAVTNFFVGFDDGQDAYREDGSLKELFAGTPRTFNNYKYGYGHGYHRFNAIVATLERYIETKANKYGVRNSKMTENQALDVLKVISQDPGTEKTSFTQYSAIYNLARLSVIFRLQRDYTKAYTFELK